MKTRTPARSPNRYADESLTQLEAGLVRIVGGRGTQALVQRSRDLCASGQPGSNLSGTLMQLATALLGESLALRLRQLGADAASDTSPTLTGPH
jgi:hypothetical protein